MAFSDDELEQRKRNKQNSLQQKNYDKADQEAHSKNWNNKPTSNSQQAVPQGNRNRSNEEEEVWVQRRRMHSEEVAQVIVRAKQRKEEEEKRFLKSRQGAAKKLQQLEEKISKCKQDKEVDDSQGTINPLVVPPQPIQPVPIPVPEWERDKDGGVRIPIENSSSKPHHRESTSDFRKLSQIEGRNFIRKETRSIERDSRERGDPREPSGPSFSKQFQSNLPPRFQKQQQMRNNSSSQSQVNASSMSFGDQYDIRWQQNHGKNSPGIRKIRQESEEFDSKEQEEQERKDTKKIGSDDGYHGSYLSVQENLKSENKYDDSHDYRSHDLDYRREDNWEKDNKSEKQDLFNEHHITSHSSNEDRHDKYEDKVQDRFERPQRPDSRDSRASRDSRHSRESVRDSDIRDYNGSWADTPFEQSYDDRRKEHIKDDRRAVPGPITRDRIEAEDFKSEKKNLTQLKRGGYMSEKKILEIKKDDQEVNNKMKASDWNESIITENRNGEELGPLKAWADNVSSNTVALENSKFMETTEKCSLMQDDNNEQETVDNSKIEKDIDEKDDKRKLSLNRRCVDPPRQQGWGGVASGSYVYRSSWSKKNDLKRTPRPGTSNKTLNKNREWHGTDSDVSIDEVTAYTDNVKEERSLRSVSKNIKKYEKDDKNKETKMETLKGNCDRKLESSRRDNYVPRGEPSRHGRGGGNFRSRGGLSNRVERFDVYGPPSSKSPFGQHEEKDKKCFDENAADNISSDERTKQNQQVLSAGINVNMNKSEINYSKKIDERTLDNNKARNTSHLHQKKSKIDEIANIDHCDTSDNSEEHGSKDSKNGHRFSSKNPTSMLGTNRTNASNITRRINPPPRFNLDKRNNYSVRHEGSNVRPNYSVAIKKESIKTEDDKSSEFVQALDKNCKIKENVIEDEQIDLLMEENNAGLCDADGFQEVKSKKTGQRQKSFDDKPIIKPVLKTEKDQKLVERKRTNNVSTAQLTPQQIANIPSLMDTPINPPVIVQQISNKSQFDRTRQNKLPPRLAKQRENHRLQKVQMQQQGICDVNDINQVGHNINMYGLKEGSTAMAGRITNAWEKPLGSHLRTEPETVLNVGIENSKTLEQPQQCANGSNIDKVN